MTAKSRVRPHLYVPPSAGELDHAGRGACEQCGLLGEAGDKRHTLPVVPEQAVVLGRYEHEDSDS